MALSALDCSARICTRGINANIRGKHTVGILFRKPPACVTANVREIIRSGIRVANSNTDLRSFKENRDEQSTLCNHAAERDTDNMNAPFISPPNVVEQRNRVFCHATRPARGDVNIQVEYMQKNIRVRAPRGVTEPHTSIVKYQDRVLAI